MACQIVAVLMTLRDLQDHAGFTFKISVSHSCAAVDKISTDVACHMVSSVIADRLVVVLWALSQLQLH